MQMARLIGVSVTSVQRWESGAALPRGRRLAKLAGKMGIEQDYLLASLMRWRSEAVLPKEG